nr:MAG: major capsid protein [Microviridae sp.]
MSSPFGKNTSPANKVKRNSFDLSRSSSVTLNWGRITPFMCLPVLPGDSAKISLNFGIRAMPTAFPVQTKIRADVHYFYVRNRNLWKDWPNFIGMTGKSEGYELPKLVGSEFKADCYRDGSLADYLGVPTSITGNKSYSSPASWVGDFADNPSEHTWRPISTSPEPCIITPSASSPDGSFMTCLLDPLGAPDSAIFRRAKGYTVVVQLEFTGSEEEWDRVSSYFNKMEPQYVTAYLLSDALSSSSLTDFNCLTESGGFYRTSIDFFPESRKGITVSFDILKNFPVSINLQGYPILGLAYNTANRIKLPFNRDNFEVRSYIVNTNSRYEHQDAIDFVGNNPEALPDLNALPFRAYESIYNAFYRDQRNNPYMVDGYNDPNVYLPTTDGGPDNTYYPWRYRNWEQDFITTAVPTPQQGIAPLVGISSSGVATFELSDGTPYKVELTTSEDGDTITGAKYTKNLPNEVARSLVNVATSGISINDFRGVNALQRWLEMNMRRGLKYKDQIKSHFGVDVSYAELDMPEFIGGATQFFDSMQINQTSQSDGSDPLGSYAGQLACVGGSKHRIKHYCDEHGYIIGLISLVPVPAYSQLMPKDFTKSSPLDYFFPEFGHLGMQPITYNEICPLQAIATGVPLNSTYGYQRSWYEYLSATDEVHGDFRYKLRDFVLYRDFGRVPSLSEEFLTVRPEQLNEIFTVSEIPDPSDTGSGEMVPIDPFLGQLHIDCVMKRPIPRFGVPRLE